MEPAQPPPSTGPRWYGTSRDVPRPRQLPAREPANDRAAPCHRARSPHRRELGDRSARRRLRPRRRRGRGPSWFALRGGASRGLAHGRGQGCHQTGQLPTADSPGDHGGPGGVGMAQDVATHGASCWGVRRSGRTDVPGEGACRTFSTSECSTRWEPSAARPSRRVMRSKRRRCGGCWRCWPPPVWLVGGGRCWCGQPARRWRWQSAYRASTSAPTG